MKDIITSKEYLSIKNKCKDIFCIIDDYWDTDVMKDRDKIIKSLDLLDAFLKSIK